MKIKRVLYSRGGNPAIVETSFSGHRIVLLFRSHFLRLLK